MTHHQPVETLLCLVGQLLDLLAWRRPKRAILLLLSHALLSLLLGGPPSLACVCMLVGGHVYMEDLEGGTPRRRQRALMACNQLARLGVLLRSTHIHPNSSHLPPRLLFLLLSRLLLRYSLGPSLALYLDQAFFLICFSTPFVSLFVPRNSTPIHDISPNKQPSVHLNHSHNGTEVVDVRIRITIIEHQRWRQDTGWSGEMTALDKETVGGRWTDEAGLEVREKTRGELVRLPPSSAEEGWWWRWVEPGWTIVGGGRKGSDDGGETGQEMGPTDSDGWAYFDHRWRPLSSPSFFAFTRKRRWSRLAIRQSRPTSKSP